MISDIQISEYLRGLESKATRVKYGSSKALRLAAAESPERVYPHFECFARQLAGDNTVFRWNAIWTLGHLAPADTEGRLDRMLRRFCAPISGPELIGAANSIGAAAEIALAKPYLAVRIAHQILKVEHGEYATPECRNVAIGHAIRALSRMQSLVGHDRQVAGFVERQRDNPRPAIRQKAAQFLRRQARMSSSAT